jgi:cell division protease FtsH
MERKWSLSIGYFIAVFIIIALFQLWLASREVAEISYTEAVRLAQDGHVTSVTLTESQIRGHFKQARDRKTDFVAVRVDPNAADVFQKAGVEVSGASDNNWFTTLLSWIAPTVVFLGIWILFFRGFADRQGMGGLISIGKSKAKVYLEKDTGVSFDDVAGVDEAKLELQEIVSF